MCKKIITCQVCGWIGNNATVGLYKARGDIIERCPVCHSEELLEAAYVASRKPQPEVHGG